MEAHNGKCISMYILHHKLRRATNYCAVGQKLLIAIDRTQWGCINLLTIALIWHKRAIPLYWCLLPKLGSSNLSEQTLTLEQVLP